MFQSKPFGDRAFHGDEYLLRLVDYISYLIALILSRPEYIEAIPLLMLHIIILIGFR